MEPLYEAQHGSKHCRERRLCVECGEPLRGRQERWCGQDCVTRYQVRQGGSVARREVLRRDRGVCALCGWDTGELRALVLRADQRGDEAWLQDLQGGSPRAALSRWDRRGGRAGRRLPARPQEGTRDWHRLEQRRLVLGLLGLGLEAVAWRKTWWDCNHRLPFATGGDGCGLGNLETLCLPCHGSETALLASRIAEARVRPGQLPRGVLYWVRGEALPRLLPQATDLDGGRVTTRQSTFTCAFCGVAKTVEGRARGRKYCSPQCRLASYSSRYPQRFWEKVDQRAPGGCWTWTSHLDRDGYGQTSGPDRRTHRAHRIAWWLVYGTWPHGSLLHGCDVRACVNPAHLSEGDHDANMAEAKERGRFTGRRGEGNVRAVMTEDQVRAILAYSPCPHEVRTVADHFGVSDSAVRDVVKRRTWKHLDHVVAVRDGGGGAALPDLRTLCLPCHRDRTRGQQGPRRARRLPRLAAERCRDGGGCGQGVEEACVGCLRYRKRVRGGRGG